MRGWTLAGLLASACPSADSEGDPAVTELVRLRVETQADGLHAKSVQVHTSRAWLPRLDAGCRPLSQPEPLDLRGDPLDISDLGDDWQITGTRSGHHAVREVSADLRWQTVPMRRGRSWGASTDDLLRVGGSLQVEAITVDSLGAVELDWSGDYAPEHVALELRVGARRVRCVGEGDRVKVPALWMALSDGAVWLVGERVRARQMPDGRTVVGQTELAVPISVDLRQTGSWTRPAEGPGVQSTQRPLHAERGPSVARRRSKRVRGG